MKKVLGVAFIAALMSSTALALPLEEAVRTALQTNPDVGIVVEDQRAISYELKQSEAGYKPTVDLNAGFGHEYTKNGTTRTAASNGTRDDSFVNMPRYETGLVISQTLFDGYLTESEVARQKSRVVSATRRVKETSELVALDAVQAYLEARRQRELATLAEENVELHRATLDLVSRKVEGGAATVADQQQAASRLASAEASLEDAKARLRDADATYSRVIGENPGDLERPTAPFWAMPQSVDEAIDWSIQNNPTVSVSKADLETAIREFDTAKANFFPTVNFEVGADANRNVDGTRGSEYGLEAMVRMTYNLYNGGRDFNRRNELLSRIAESRQFYNRSVRLTEEEMRLAWNSRESSVTRVRAQRREVEANDIVRQTYRAQFDVGARNLLELLDSENEYFFAKTNLISTEFQAIFSVYRVLATGGVLLSALEVPKPLETKTEFDPVEPLGVDLEAKELQGANIDLVLGEEAAPVSASGIEQLLDAGDGDFGDGDLLDPNAESLTLDPNAEGLSLDPEEGGLTLDPQATGLTLDPSAAAAVDIPSDNVEDADIVAPSNGGAVPALEALDYGALGTDTSDAAATSNVSASSNPELELMEAGAVSELPELNSLVGTGVSTVELSIEDGGAYELSASYGAFESLGGASTSGSQATPDGLYPAEDEIFN